MTNNRKTSLLTNEKLRTKPEKPVKNRALLVGNHFLKRTL